MKRTLPIIQNEELLKQALTHRSYANENPLQGRDNERLEFLGDAVLGFVVGELLFKRYPHVNEAQLTRLRSSLVDEKHLATVARKIELGARMRLGRGAEKDGGRDNPSLLSDTFEALIGAYYLEVGIEQVKDYVEPLLRSVADTLVFPQNELEARSLIDSKNRFQQWALARYKENPIYSIIDESGPDHAKEFTAEVRVKGELYGVGCDRRKQEAEKRAAECALRQLGLERSQNEARSV
ncbi:ribonuclease III [Oscillatoria sp. FACHB-1406]|uniref:ribonuclease III n=1 Tax=Oscillatoria sp. FACHB-1406 TaxID=2692846 RepID=UPI0016872B8C|nr:ribonuclease III [Oscillatoria sp. FACHB-1406]MBD2576629.1 ribonuclease III [Oscillatoria sp. FACHB-1406]